jgi:hypothetical protein
MGMSALPLRFLTPFPKHLSRRCGTPHVRLTPPHVDLLPIFSSPSELSVLRTVLAAARTAALEKCFGKAEPLRSLFHSHIAQQDDHIKRDDDSIRRDFDSERAVCYKRSVIFGR